MMAGPEGPANLERPYLCELSSGKQLPLADPAVGFEAVAVEHRSGGAVEEQARDLRARGALRVARHPGEDLAFAYDPDGVARLALAW